MLSKHPSLLIVFVAGALVLDVLFGRNNEVNDFFQSFFDSLRQLGLW